MRSYLAAARIETPSAVTSTSSARLLFSSLARPHITKSVLLIFKHERLRRGTTIAMGESAMEIPKRLWIGMVVLGACARLVPHPWNFTIPFYRNQVLGDAVYTVAIFGGYTILNRLCQPTRQAA
jgi:hypothetical protein